ncbi:hypothetical protein H70357_10610 [Paenibacillus sp. FSL H7-0357]|uniref:hypothetical protein n=1 Tax=Paenibacillus sp. FSL H7-0357 TaxID=1536774 RepID=UPI0004F86F78|nr:hypothetical protein [Paenibacillus sp. FSL H7-0357]AIQ17060.1 hypothetical protein H70357_10610 [Paenibacillus sp. FSL H7-0357]
MEKSEVYSQELAKLQDIFADVDPSKAQLVEGLLEDAAFLKAENTVLKKALKITGMVKIHPTNPDLQKPVEAARQYLKNVNSYSVIIKTLNSILNKNIIDEEDDDMKEFE